MTVPNGPSDTATFTTSNRTEISLSADTQLDGMVFGQGTSLFTITQSSFRTVTISGSGITNTSNSEIVHNFIVSSQSNLEFINTATVDHGITVTNNGVSDNSSTGGLTTFRDKASAGGGGFYCRGGEVENGLGGAIQFRDASNAGDASFVAAGGTALNAYGGTIAFTDMTTAGDARFTIDGGRSGGQTTWNVAFYGSSTAGSATFNNNTIWDDMAGGSILFWDTSTAGIATITNGGGYANGGHTVQPGESLTAFGSSSSAGNASLIANGAPPHGFPGVITFSGNATGGTSRVTVYSLGPSREGRLEIGGRVAPGVTVGSIEGNGHVFLGSKRLTVGSSSATTIFSGMIQDGGINEGSGDIGGSLEKIGNGTLTLFGANSYTGGTVVSAGKLLANNSSGSGTGTGAVTVNNSGTVLGGTGTISGPVTVNAGAVLLAGEPAAASGSLRVANNVTLKSGAIIQLVLGASGAHSSLTGTGGTWTFASNQGFAFINRGAEPGFYDNVITGLPGYPGGTASWTITTPGFAGTFAYDGAGNIDLTISAAPSPPPTTFGNISTRLRVEAGENVLIGGFIVTGTQAKRIIVRAIGPSLPVVGALTDPVLELRNSSGGLIVFNNNWRDDPAQESEIIATTIPPLNNLESAIVTTLPANGSAYTAIVRGVDNGTGIAVVEAYDLDQTVDSKLANISTRGLVQTGYDVLAAGLIVLGHNPIRVIVRAIGPSLPLSQALTNPTLSLHNGNGAMIASNDNWRTGGQEEEIIATGIPPSDDKESAIVRNLTPGSYTAIVRGVNNATGIAVVEAYGLN